MTRGGKPVATSILLTLAHLVTAPEQRLVHQVGDGEAEVGPCVFFRSPRLAGALKPPGGLHTLKAMLRNGWLEPKQELNYSFQVEYQVSAAAKALFASDPEWMLAEDVWRRTMGLPAKLRLVGAGPQA